MYSSLGSELILRVVREGLLLAILVSAPPLLASLAVGLIVSVLQAATQVHEHTLVFVPKLVAVTLVLIAMGPLLGAQVLRFTQALLLAIPTIH
jgi:Flagellar biosynthesis pathway, component FliQ